MQKMIHWLRLLFVVGICLAACFFPVAVRAATRQAPTLPPLLASRELRDPAPKPTAQSLLVVLLDRSGSLYDTDPAQYSASIAKVLADLWPGKMAVIFFSGTKSPLYQIGPVDLSQSGAREQLKSQIESQRTNLQGWTPTQMAVEQAEQLLTREDYPVGSRVVLVTDGQPSLPDDIDGNNQIKAIGQQDVPVFSTHHVPISTFGLGNEVPDYGKTFLSQVADQTSGEYHHVTDPAQLAQPVLQMYANWLGLSFVRTTGHHTW